MPLRTGLSHAVASLVSMLLSVAVTTYLHEYTVIESTTELAGSFAEKASGGTIEAGIAGPILILTCLSFVWGIMYHFRRFNRTGNPRRINSVGK